jgi:ABC-type multidrug transport system fused ATPase/permease subunit
MMSAAAQRGDEIDNVSFAYRDDRLVLQDINLDIPSRSFVALVGIPAAVKAPWPA